MFKIWRKFFSRNHPAKDGLVTLTEKARQEWDESQMLFNEVRDPELINYAIFAMEAAERKYMYLLREARQNKVVHQDIYAVFEQNSS